MRETFEERLAEWQDDRLVATGSAQAAIDAVNRFDDDLDDALTSWRALPSVTRRHLAAELEAFKTEVRRKLAALKARIEGIKLD